MTQFLTVGIVGKQGDPARARPTLRRLADHLRARQRLVLLDAESARLLEEPPETALTETELGTRADLVVAVGGDGTLLHAARILAAHRVPLLGINLGRLGFLADVSPDEIEPVMDRILAGAFETDSRSMLLARVFDEPDGERCHLALNDVVVHKWNNARMIEFETWIDGVFVNAQRSDGLIVSTPTGSTAYALSGGGPLLDPTLDVMLLVPICPHDLSNRPLVVPGNRRIEIRVFGAEPGHAAITCDGQTLNPLPPDGRVRIVRHPDRARLLHPRGHDHYQILRAKLGWGGHLQSGRRPRIHAPELPPLADREPAAALETTPC